MYGISFSLDRMHVLTCLRKHTGVCPANFKEFENREDSTCTRQKMAKMTTLLWHTPFLRTTKLVSRTLVIDIVLARDDAKLAADDM